MLPAEQSMKGVKSGGSTSQESDVPTTKQHMTDVKAQGDVWQKIQTKEPIDLQELTEELAELRKALTAEAKEPEHYEAISAVRSAELEAEKKDGPKVLGYLSKAGTWVLDVATRIGTTIAAEAIKHSLGMK